MSTNLGLQTNWQLTVVSNSAVQEKSFGFRISEERCFYDFLKMLFESDPYQNRSQMAEDLTVWKYILRAQWFDSVDCNITAGR